MMMKVQLKHLFKEKIKAGVATKKIVTDKRRLQERQTMVSYHCILHLQVILQTITINKRYGKKCYKLAMAPKKQS